MGLCKCPKRKVTNLFCYEHRVNVCQTCVVTSHPRCVVQSYIRWLQDSDYDPTCGLCRRDLSQGECLRLVCYHLFHWECLKRYAQEMPETTAPAGYACPACGEGIIPKDNSASPVADLVRERLATVAWARMGLGASPLVSETTATSNPRPIQSAIVPPGLGQNPSKDRQVILTSPPKPAQEAEPFPIHYHPLAETVFNSSTRSHRQVERIVCGQQQRQPFVVSREEEDKYTRRHPHMRNHFAIKRPCRFIFFVVAFLIIITLFFVRDKENQLYTDINSNGRVL